MLFNSWQYAVFLPVVFALYWALPHKWRWPLLLVASYYFYMSWDAKYVVLILFTTGVSYAAALLLERGKGDRTKQKLILAAALIACLGVLFVFKYLSFFFESLQAVLGAFSLRLHPMTLKLVLPVGISFYTFQTLSYVIDVYRGDISAERNFGVYATFVSFFPQLVAGPIERSKNLLPQIKAEHTFSCDRAIEGAKLILWGLYKKVVIADRLAVYVDMVYGDVASYRGFALALASFFFTIQIYCDFSGYSDIARGTAKLLGIELMENFKSPYLSASVKEFWSRWHISLSTWFRDYVYIPLGGNRRGKAREYWNLLVTFLVSGLWHGANWTFVAWGGVHGLAQIAEKALGLDKSAQKRNILSVFRVLIVFVFVNFAWVLFRAQSIAEAGYVFSHMWYGISDTAYYLHIGFNDIQMNKGGLFMCVMFYLFPLFCYDSMVMYDGRVREMLLKQERVRWACYILLGVLFLILAPKGVASEFVYFQF